MLAFLVGDYLSPSPTVRLGVPGPPAGQLADFKLTTGNWGLGSVRSQAQQQPPPAAGWRASRFRLEWACAGDYLSAIPTVRENQGRRGANLPTSS